MDTGTTESSVHTPDPFKFLSVLLEGAFDVRYKARNDIPGVRFSRQGEDKEIRVQLVVKSDDRKEEYDQC